MSYKQLYDEIQCLTPKVKTAFLKSKALEFSRFTAVKEVWSGEYDKLSLRGSFFEGPAIAPMSLAKNEAIIILARDLNTCWRRFVYTKELMHVFDSADELSDTQEKLDAQLFFMEDPSKDRTDQGRAEYKAFWRALGVLCPEKDRQQYKTNRTNGALTSRDIALHLKLPEVYVEHLMGESFSEIIHTLK